MKRLLACGLVLALTACASGAAAFAGGASRHACCPSAKRASGPALVSCCPALIAPTAGPRSVAALPSRAPDVLATRRAASVVVRVRSWPRAVFLARAAARGPPLG